MKKILILASVALLAACSDGSSNRSTPAAPATPDPAPVPVNAQFEVSTTNLTVAQPLSPVAVVVHESSVRLFDIGSPASIGLEHIAEEGDASMLLDSIEGAAESSGSGIVGPGASDTLMLELPDDDSSGMSISLITMLVNTNDAFTAVNSMDLSTLAVGDSISVSLPGYDAGTEANTEAGADIPGPAGGGEGFNGARDDIRDQVTMHSGVVTADDGLAGSALNQMHRWDNPVARVTITRTQ